MKDTGGKERPMRRTRWTVPPGRIGDVPHPPVLLVFSHIGDRNPNRTVPRLIELTRHLWQGKRQRGLVWRAEVPVWRGGSDGGWRVASWGAVCQREAA
ncbi:hypothetical protein [Streptomyces sp. NPDC018000]|uniref:hypothetical protein n=1 Tax=Streptomyces sp. NPDC018000 TaxID=3365028 RepID=UPI003789B998